MAGTLNPDVRICLNGCGRKLRRKHKCPKSIDDPGFIWEVDKEAGLPAIK